MFPACSTHPLLRIQNQQDAVVIANRIIQIIGQQCPRFEAHVHLHGKGWIADAARQHALVVLLGRHRFLQRAIAGNHSGSDLPLELQSPDNFLPGSVERRCQSAPAVFGAHAQVRAIQPCALWLVRGQPSTLDDFGESVVHMVEVEVQAQSGRRAHHAFSIQSDKLPVFEQLHVFQVMRVLKALILGQSGETDALQFFKLRGVLRARLRDHNSISEFSVVPAHGASQEDNLHRGNFGRWRRIWPQP